MLQLQQFFKMMPKEKDCLGKAAISTVFIGRVCWSAGGKRTNTDTYAWEPAPKRRQSKYYPTSRSAGQVCSQLQRPTCCICSFLCSSAVCAALQQLRRISHDRSVPTLYFDHRKPGASSSSFCALSPSAEINAIAEASVAHSILSVL